jgi:hypothetical protein
MSCSMVHLPLSWFDGRRWKLPAAGPSSQQKGCGEDCAGDVLAISGCLDECCGAESKTDKTDKTSNGVLRERPPED